MLSVLFFFQWLWPFCFTEILQLGCEPGHRLIILIRELRRGPLAKQLYLRFGPVHGSKPASSHLVNYSRTQKSQTAMDKAKATLTDLLN